MKSSATVENIAPGRRGLKKVEETPSQHPQFDTAVKALGGVNKTKVFLAEKYFAGQKSILSEELEELHKVNPTMPVKAVVVHILEDLPDFLPAENVLEVTRFVVEAWTKLNRDYAQ